MARVKTNYRGVFYREVNRTGGHGKERVYYIVFKKDGKIIEEKVGKQFADNMTPARAAHIRGERMEGKRISRKEARQKAESERQAEESKWTISRLWSAYTENNPDIKGIVTDRNRFQNYIQPALGERMPGEIVPLDVDRIRLNLLKERSPATARNVLELLRRIINFGAKKQLCPPLAFAIQMPRVNNLKTEDLTGEELTSLLDAINADPHPQAGAMMQLALFTGMRRGEMFKLKWTDVDVSPGGFITLKDPKGGPDQKIPLNDEARGILTRIEKTRSPFVFPGRGGRMRTDIAKAVNRIKTAAGLPKEFRALHGLRHVYASMLASSGQVDMYTLQKLLTHKSPAMTQRYAHLRDETLKRASQVAGDIVSQAFKPKKEQNKVVTIER